MAEAWTYEKRGDIGVVMDENGLPVCKRVSEQDGELIASAPVLAERVRILREALVDNLQAWEGEEESVREEHADLIEETRAALETTEEET